MGPSGYVTDWSTSLSHVGWTKLKQIVYKCVYETCFVPQTISAIFLLYQYKESKLFLDEKGVRCIYVILIEQLIFYHPSASITLRKAKSKPIARFKIIEKKLEIAETAWILVVEESFPYEIIILNIHQTNLIRDLKYYLRTFK